MTELDETLASGEPSGDADTIEADSDQALRSGSGPRHPDAPLEPGAKVSRYEVVERLGAGGMGVVYRAYDPQLDREVALKLLKRAKKDHELAASRMLREAQSAAKIRHPNVVTVYDAGEVDGHVFIAMELMRGSDLGQWFTREHSWRAVVRVMIEAAQGLRAAHESGIVHRDFKPDNVFVEADGSVKVLDFGLARAAYDSDTQSQVAHELEQLTGQQSSPDASTVAALEKLTHTGALVGTPAYMAPEQYLLDPIDARTDQFSFCVTLFMGVYGHRPFAGRNYAALTMNVVNGRLEEPNDPSRAPTELLDILRRGLSTEPEHRYPSMDALIEALRELLEPPRVRARLADSKGLVAALGAFALVLGTGLALRGRTPDPPPDPPPDQGTLTSSGADSGSDSGAERPPELPVELAAAEARAQPVAGPQLWLTRDTLRILDADHDISRDVPLGPGADARPGSKAWILEPVAEALATHHDASELSVYDPVTLFLDRRVAFATLVRAIFSAGRSGYTRYDLAVDSGGQTRVFEIRPQIYADDEARMQPRAALELYLVDDTHVQVGARAWAPDDQALNEARLRAPLDASGGSCELPFEAPSTLGLEPLLGLGAALCARNRVSAPLIVSAADEVSWAAIATVLSAALPSSECAGGIVLETRVEAHASCDAPVSIDELDAALAAPDTSSPDSPDSPDNFKRWCFINSRLKNKKVCKRSRAACISEARHWVDNPRRACEGER